MENKFDKEIQELFKAYQEQPSANCWDKVSSQLDAMQNIPDASQSSAASSSANGSAFSQFVGSVVGKLSIAVTSVAAIGGLSYLIATSESQESSQTIIDMPSQVEVLVEEKDIQEEKAIVEIVEQPETSNEIQKPEIVEKSSVSQEKQHIEKGENTTINFSNTLSENNSIPQNQPAIAKKSEPEVKNQSKETEKQPIAEKQETVKSKQEKKETPKKQQIIQEQPNTNAEVSKKESTNEIPLIDVSKISISNILTPNGDGYNDYFIISNIDDYPENNLVVFRKDGKVVYERENYRNEWNGEHVVDGVYYYVFTFDYQGKPFMRQGSITVKR